MNHDQMFLDYLEPDCPLYEPDRAKLFAINHWESLTQYSKNLYDAMFGLASRLPGCLS